MKYPILIWLAVVLMESGRHIYLIKIKKQSPNKAFSLAMRSLIALALIVWEFVLYYRDPEVFILAYIFSGWFIHDTILAMALGHKPWYLNGTGPIDIAQQKIGATSAFVLKGIGFLATVGMYFINYPV